MKEIGSICLDNERIKLLVHQSTVILETERERAKSIRLAADQAMKLSTCLRKAAVAARTGLCVCGKKMALMTIDGVNHCESCLREVFMKVAIKRAIGEEKFEEMFKQFRHNITVKARHGIHDQQH